MFVDYLINGLTGSRVNGLFVAKTTTYMNLSGKSVQALMQKQKAKLEDLIIVHDDLDIPLGKFRIVKGYGPKLHNGIDSIEEKLGTKDFLRVRIGVDNRTSENRIPGIEYVLRDFEEEESRIVHNTLFANIFSLLKKERLI